MHSDETKELTQLLSGFEPVSLDKMSAAGLMKRIDTKYLTVLPTLYKLLQKATEDYFIVEIDGNRRMSYYTCYFDTSDTNMYYEHQRGKKARQKIRIRKYENETPLSFLEVKDKNNKGRTSKTRIKIDENSTREEMADFVTQNSKYTLDRLIKQIENRFRRITLVKKDFTERVTIDTDIRFHNLITGAIKSERDLVIIEWKRKSLAEHSPMKRFLRELGIRESGFSKYVTGMALTNPELRKNRLKPRLRKINKLTENFI